MQQRPDLCSQHPGDETDLISSPLDRIIESRVKMVAGSCVKIFNHSRYDIPVANAPIVRSSNQHLRKSAECTGGDMLAAAVCGGAPPASASSSGAHSVWKARSRNEQVPRIYPMYIVCNRLLRSGASPRGLKILHLDATIYMIAVYKWLPICTMMQSSTCSVTRCDAPEGVHWGNQNWETHMSIRFDNSAAVVLFRSFGHLTRADSQRPKHNSNVW
jgi:hypothetical protein